MQKQLFFSLVLIFLFFSVVAVFMTSKDGSFFNFKLPSISKNFSLQKKEEKLSQNEITLDINPKTEKELYLPIKSPVKLDFLSKEEVLNLRKAEVLEFSHLITGEYTPSDHVFGQIVSEKPWWGMNGQYCGGIGKQSIEGPSEETRLLLNPYVLVGVVEKDVIVTGGICEMIYPKIMSLIWNVREKRGSVVFDHTRYSNLARKYGHSDLTTLQLENYNARDFGYEYMIADESKSKNIKPAVDSAVFDSTLKSGNYIHLGNSCGYPGGCNNASPYEPHLHFNVTKVPATLQLNLYKNKPEGLHTPPDFKFILEFR